MIACCGLDCAKYDAYRTTVTDDNALKEKPAKLWSELNGITILPEHINCEGCKKGVFKTYAAVVLNSEEAFNNLKKHI
ncbi:MAG: DUF3795 domain-containing protein [Clostridia bacterium]|nr:DUF3795 domain-containing protein [Clostridia bacterium]